jgi:hypothetical protein
MSHATTRNLPPGGTSKQRVKVSADNASVEWVDNFDDEWDDIIIPGTSVRTTGATPPDIEAFGPTGTIFLPTFAGTGVLVEQAFGAFEMPHSWKEGTIIRPHIHWAPKTNAAGNVKWQLSYSIADANGNFGAEATLKAVAAGGAAWKHVVTEFETLAMAGLHIGAIIAFRIFRNPADGEDTYEDDAYLLSLGVHFQQDRAGSTGVFTK